MGADEYMQNTLQSAPSDRPETYRIEIGGKLDAGWSQWFGGLTVAVTTNAQDQAVTTLTGTVRDQAALHGLLGRIRDLCLPLLLVQRLERAQPDQPGGPGCAQDLKQPR